MDNVGPASRCWHLCYLFYTILIKHTADVATVPQESGLLGKWDAEFAKYDEPEGL